MAIHAGGGVTFDSSIDDFTLGVEVRYRLVLCYRDGLGSPQTVQGFGVAEGHGAVDVTGRRSRG